MQQVFFLEETYSSLCAICCRRIIILLTVTHNKRADLLQPLCEFHSRHVSVQNSPAHVSFVKVQCSALKLPVSVTEQQILEIKRRVLHLHTTAI